jgi:hypothetical protein
MRDMLLGFSIDKTVSDALNPYMEAQDTQCILNRTPADTITLGISGTGTATGTALIFCRGQYQFRIRTIIPSGTVPFQFKACRICIKKRRLLHYFVVNTVEREATYHRFKSVLIVG